MCIGIVEENTILRKWYEDNGFIHIGTKKFDFFRLLVDIWRGICKLLCGLLLNGGMEMWRFASAYIFK